MKTLIFAMIALTSISASADSPSLPGRAECSARLSYSKEALKLATDRFNVGEYTRSDVDQAKFELLFEQLLCGEILRGDKNSAGTYCSNENRLMAQEWLKAVKAEATAGHRPQEDVKNVVNSVAKMIGICD